MPGASGTGGEQKSHDGNETERDCRKSGPGFHELLLGIGSGGLCNSLRGIPIKGILETLGYLRGF
jgi:hypothetical protein